MGTPYFKTSIEFLFEERYVTVYIGKMRKGFFDLDFFLDKYGEEYLLNPDERSFLGINDFIPLEFND